MFTRIAPLVALSVVIGSLWGCSGGDGSEKVTTYHVSGKISVQGKGIADVSVMFSPKDGQPYAQGRTNENGEYQLTTYEANDGAASGKYTVVLVKIASSGGAAAGPPSHDAYASGAGAAGAHSPKAAKAGVTEGAIPSKYGTIMDSPLSAEVGKEPKTFDFDLTP